MIGRRSHALITLATTLAVGAAAVASYAMAITRPPSEMSGELGPATEVIVSVLLGLLVLLACRHLVLLWLSAVAVVTAPRAYASGAFPPPFVSIIVPAFNEAPMIGSVLESLLAIQYPRFEVIVVDDGSSDPTFLRALAFRQRRPDVACRVLAKGNGGKFDALNHGIAQARGEIIVCIDGDSVLDPAALAYCVRHFADPRVGGVAGNVRVYNRRNFWSALQALEYIVGYSLFKRAQSAARLVAIVPGPLGAFRKDALEQAGGYDGDTFAEDFDLTFKLISAGWHVVYEPRAVVLTEAPERMIDLLRQRYRWARGSLQVLLKRKRAMLEPRRTPLRFLGVWYLSIEYVAWPVLHMASQVLFVAGGIFLGVHGMVVFLWLQLIVLETAIAVYSVAIENENLALILLGPVYRIFYIIFLDVARVFSSLEEFGRVKMGWDKVSRLGTFNTSAK